VATFRHNGLPTAILFLVAAVCALRPPPRAALKVVALAIAGVLVVQVGVFRLLGVQPFHPAFRDQTVLHQVAAGLHPGTAFDRADYAALGAVMPVTRWLESYRCESVIPTLSAVLQERAEPAYRRLRPRVYRAWSHALVRSPGVLARHHACVSGLIWNPLATFHVVSVAIVPNGYGMATRPRLPAVHDVLVGLQAVTTSLPWRAVIWGPALHLVVLLAAAGYVATRTRRRAALLPFVPALAHTLVLFLAIPSAEYRLQYPVVVAGLLAPLLAHALGRPRA
jgi:hypothetical protein